MTSEVPDLGEFLSTDAAYRKLLDAERAKSEAKSESRILRKLLGEKEAELIRSHRELALYDRVWKAKPKWAVKHSAQRSQHSGTLVSILSDTHYGEVVDPREMDGENAYNMAIAESRTKRYFAKLIELPREYLHGITYDGIVLALGGDLVSGDIHDELTETNELSTYETIETVLPWLIAGVNSLVEAYGNVHIVSAPGNHGRRTRKPHAKRFSAENADTHIARLLAQSVTGATFDIPRSIDVNFSIYETHFTLEHGQKFRGGDGQVGALGPIKRGVLRKKHQTQAVHKPFDIMLLGHFHQLVVAPGQGFIANGALKGYDEYARGEHYVAEPAQQALFLVSPQHGVQASMPVLVSDRKDEGW